ncbi:MAG: hypothetical protein PHT33_12390, partial [bacterium]|nr:hypothetical protein [bacterium]
MGTSWYPDKKETYGYISQGNFLPPNYFKTAREDKVKLNVKYRTAFTYSEFGCIVDYLNESYGREKLMVYMKRLLSDTDHDKVFHEVYGIEFSSFIKDFLKHVDDAGMN